MTKSILLIDTLSVPYNNKEILLQLGVSKLQKNSNKKDIFSIDSFDPYLIKPSIKFNIPSYIKQKRGITKRILDTSAYSFKQVYNSLNEYFDINNSLVIAWDMSSYKILETYCRLEKLAPLINSNNFIPLKPNIEMVLDQDEPINSIEKALTFIGKEYVPDGEHDCCSNRTFNLSFLVQWFYTFKIH